MEKIDGRKIARKIIEGLKKQKRPDKILAAVFIGGRPDSKSFLRQKELMAQELGVPFELFQFGEEILEDDLIKEIKRIGDDPEIGGIIAQLPLPSHYNRSRILSAINSEKDVDALNSGNNSVFPPAVEAAREILRIMNYKLENRAVAVVGAKGFLVGAPISKWLEESCEKLIKIDIGDDLFQIKEADLVITGVGKAGFIKPKMLKKGAGVIDFGYSIGKAQSANGKAQIFGDLDIRRLAISDSRLAFYTPTPGGTGPILVAAIFKNFYKLNKIYK